MTAVATTTAPAVTPLVTATGLGAVAVFTACSFTVSSAWFLEYFKTLSPALD